MPRSVAVAVCLLLLAVMASVTLALGLSNHAIHTSDHRWCTALVLITRNPVPKPANPHKNPSREQNYQAYLAFVHLRQEFGCDPR